MHPRGAVSERKPAALCDPTARAPRARAELPTLPTEQRYGQSAGSTVLPLPWPDGAGGEPRPLPPPASGSISPSACWGLGGAPGCAVCFFFSFSFSIPPTSSERACGRGGGGGGGDGGGGGGLVGGAPSVRGGKRGKGGISVSVPAGRRRRGAIGRGRRGPQRWGGRGAAGGVAPPWCRRNHRIPVAVCRGEGGGGEAAAVVWWKRTKYIDHPTTAWAGGPGGERGGALAHTPRAQSLAHGARPSGAAEGVHHPVFVGGILYPRRLHGNGPRAWSACAIHPNPSPITAAVSTTHNCP